MSKTIGSGFWNFLSTIHLITLNYLTYQWVRLTIVLVLYAGRSEGLICIFCGPSPQRNTPDRGIVWNMRLYDKTIRVMDKILDSLYGHITITRHWHLWMYSTDATSHYHRDTNGSFWCARETLQAHGLKVITTIASDLNHNSRPKVFKVLLTLWIRRFADITGLYVGLPVLDFIHQIVFIHTHKCLVISTCYVLFIITNFYTIRPHWNYYNHK